mgnify:CR=1 FL=1
MPIHCEIQVNPLDKNEFAELDYIVTGFAFDIHNQLGRFFPEHVYQNELARRCTNAGLEVSKEVSISVAYGNFRKHYMIDLLVERGGLYELKTAVELNGNHKRQAINYLLLLGLHHGKVLNFRPFSVQGNLVSTQLTTEIRRDYTLCCDGWDGDNETDVWLLDLLCDLFDEWGLFLEVDLYKQALLHFSAGPDAGVQDVDVMVGGETIGSQKMCLLDAETAWHISAIRSDQMRYSKHLRRILDHMDLSRMHWINLENGKVCLLTIHK